MNNSTRLFLALAITIIGYLPATSFAQEQPGKKDSIVSTILNEKRFIQVVLPAKYKPGSADKYDVLYVLDGDSNTKLAADMQRFMRVKLICRQLLL